MRADLDAWLATRQPVGPQRRGALLAKLFATKRDEVRTQIQERIKQESTSESTSVPKLKLTSSMGVYSGEGHGSDSSHRPLTDFAASGEPSNRGAGDSAAATRRSPWIWAVAGAATIAVVAIALSMMGPSGESVGQAPADTPPLPTAAIAAVLPPSNPRSADARSPDAGPVFRRLAVQAEPKSARLLLDGRPLGNGAFEGNVLVRGQRYELTVQADGYTPQTLDLSPQGDASMTVVLSQVEPDPPAPSLANPVERHPPPPSPPRRREPRQAAPARSTAVTSPSELRRPLFAPGKQRKRAIDTESPY